MERNVDKATITTTNYDRSKEAEECALFQTFGLLGAIFTGKIESRFCVAKAGFNKKKALFGFKFD
jgi:hypothetical protein